jgi:hypothetical protein
MLELPASEAFYRCATKITNITEWADWDGSDRCLRRLHGHEFILFYMASKTYQVLNTIGKSSLGIGTSCSMHASAMLFSIVVNDWHAVPLQTIEISVQTHNNEKETPVLPSVYSRVTNSSPTFPSPSG